ncbi:hypothetical protein HS048_01305 [Planomonospora sp. ID91781]|uniref:hypothetical protein n=1 Tax=Planomonospora sp. ID91781 TaxID=2738135 RepID=UPI0018C4508B|nr:hypothetical protein [Planomonospora sp. ID91781]MBG0819402.1 hypothetical protein [Planomonospora sp. ID91781]
MGAGARPHGSHATWREVRRHLNEHRHELARAADRLYPDLPRVGSTHLLTRETWTPTRPVDLHRIALRWDDRPPAPAVTGREAEAGSTLPPGLPSYSQAMEALDKPRLFEDRTCYRLLDVDWPELGFARGRYFDGVDVGEAAAHEFAAARLLAEADLPLRRLVADPTDLRPRVALPAISMLTLRRDSCTGAMTFVLHWRDPARVAHGGGLYQVMPVGVFQPAEEAADFDLWKCVVREYAEEFLGRPEVYGDAFDYGAWPLYQELTEAREDGRLRRWCSGWVWAPSPSPPRGDRDRGGDLRHGLRRRHRVERGGTRHRREGHPVRRRLSKPVRPPRADAGGRRGRPRTRLEAPPYPRLAAVNRVSTQPGPVADGADRLP